MAATYTAQTDDVCGVNSAYPGNSYPFCHYFNKLNTSFCLDVWGFSYDDGAGVVQYSCNSADNQRLTKVDTDSGYFVLIFAHSGKCLEIWNWGTSDGDDVIQWACHYGDNQQWTYDATNPYRLRNRFSGKCIAVISSGESYQAEQYTCSTSNTQKWNLWK